MRKYKKYIPYIIIFATFWITLHLLPKEGGYIWEPWFINCSTSLLFTLLVHLTAQLAKTDRTPITIFGTAVFILLFCPGADRFFWRDELGLMELSSQCIVPFFIGQYMRVSKKDFHRWYFLMLLMGIFCSYTHNGITIPLCLAFVWLSFLHRKLFFRRACWPMVVGFVIGTGLSILKMWDESLTLSSDFRTMTSVTTIALHTLWDTKVFVVLLVFIFYMMLTKHRRLILIYTGKRHYVIGFCMLFSLLTLPFAPLGIDNAVTGVCFFSMFYVLFIAQYLVDRYLPILLKKKEQIMNNGESRIHSTTSPCQEL